MSDRKIENIYALTRKSGFLPCHPERQRRIFAVSIEKRFLVTLFLRMTKGEAFHINIKQNFFPCHPERQRRIFAVSIEKRFFVTLFLRMTYLGAGPERIQKGFKPASKFLGTI